MGVFELKSQLVQENKIDQNKNSAQYLFCLTQGGIRGKLSFCPLSPVTETEGHAWARRKLSSRFFFFFFLLVGKNIEMWAGG